MSRITKQILADLREETAELESMIEGADDASWMTQTPAEGWTVQDQLNHLAYFDDATTLAMRNPTEFSQLADSLMASAQDFPGEIAEQQRGLPVEATRDWLHRARQNLLTVFDATEDTRRVPWFGVSMSLASSITARLMETWAHGQDIADALAIERQPTARVRHICHLGVQTRAFSYALRGMEAPTEPVGVVLTAPDGDEWRWGPECGQNSVSGSAWDFALVVTQRRNIADTGLVVTGHVAGEWMSIAQAFAGVPGLGRAPMGAVPFVLLSP
ncbi:TIGR03084 family protein [Rhodococcus sp. ACPA4]|uniref:TIGR03084 family metal-binding protein n=1 Tax=Rhodococcus sp. ACPA4 TaxID=2028571 RepID=UPI000BB1166D|nr:TIGR03084 family metal-binding protein [Rhodococcus sp. ACPA4]PBC35817.1 TIGR03084 family protein [Rhodococcus sp. ACPA4]